MNVTAVALLGAALGVAQPPAGYEAVKDRAIELGVNYKPERRANIAQIQLIVSRDGQVWKTVDTIPPEKDKLRFEAAEDGVYLVKMVIVGKDGTRDPASPEKGPPPQKVLLDATPPKVRITEAKRVGDEVVVEWAVEEKFPDEKATKVQYQSATGAWQAVPAAAVSGTRATFRPALAGPITVQVVVQDLVGFQAATTREVGGTGTTAGYSPPPEPPAPSVPAVPATGGPVVPSVAPVVPPAVTPVVEPLAPAPKPAVVETSSTPAPAATWKPPADPAPPQPIALSSATTAPPANANVTVIRTLQFDMNFQVENGPSGVSRLDLYVTRDDGRTWGKWSSHDGKETPLRVNLDTRFNTAPEGEYGFRLVPVSGAGLSDGAPPAGTPPEFRVQVDTTAPMIKVFAPTADPAQRNTLILHWEATDKNFGRDPIGIEWSEHPNGPWKAVGAGEVVPVAAVAGGVPPARLPNTGTFAWVLPALTTPRVYLKFTAADAAGNRSEAITPNPVQVDLVKPRVVIHGISPAATSRP